MVERAPEAPLAPFGVAIRAAIVESSAFANRADFCRKMGIEQKTLRRYEIGEKSPKLEDVTRWADALGVPVVQLIGVSALPPESRVDTSDADILPTDEEEDLAITQRRKGLTDEETQKIRGVRRSVGRMELKAMLELAETIVANRSGKAVERGQVAETVVPGNLKPFGARKPKKP